MGEMRSGLRATFESAADSYDAARPSYPKQLFDDLVELAELQPRARLLEIGCGTGKATRPLLERGFSVVCIELGAQLAERARANLSGMPVEIHVAPFEVWQNQHEQFDLVYAATAWHWVDPAIRYRKAYELLQPTGHLAFWSAEHAFPVDHDPFFAEIQEIYDAIGESRPEEWPPPPPDRIPDEVAAIDATGLFEEIHVRRYVWETQYSPDQYIALLDTFSGHIAMERPERERLYGEIRHRIGRRTPPSVRRHWIAILHVARRKQAGGRASV